MATLSDRELLAALLGVGGVRAGALELAADLGRLGLGRLSRASPHELLRMPGLGPAQATRVAAAFELGRRAGQRRPDRARSLGTSRALADLGRAYLDREEQEVVVVVLLTARLRLQRVVAIARGGLCGAELRPADVLQLAVREGAPRIALIHNHPGGDPRPSQADLDATARLVVAARVLGIDLVDHVVLGRRGRHESIRSRAGGAWPASSGRVTRPFRHA